MTNQMLNGVSQENGIVVVLKQSDAEKQNYHDSDIAIKARLPDFTSHDQTGITIVPTVVNQTVVADRRSHQEIRNLVGDLMEQITGSEQKAPDVEVHGHGTSNAFLSRTSSSREQCRVCQEDKQECLIELGVCVVGLLRKHMNHASIPGSAQEVQTSVHAATNVSPPDALPTTSYWVWRGDPPHGRFNLAPLHERRCLGPLWIAFSILIGGLLLDVLISITLGVSALPVNIIIGVIIVLGLGTALRLALEFFHEWTVRRLSQRRETDVSPGYRPEV